MIEGRSEEGSQEWANPVDPVIPGETAVDHIWAKGASRVERSSSIIITWKRDL
jgi:hypothetical protein